ncbi:hypothetical protein [Rhizobium sp. A37_96]
MKDRALADVWTEYRDDPRTSGSSQGQAASTFHGLRVSAWQVALIYY